MARVGGHSGRPVMDMKTLHMPNVKPIATLLGAPLIMRSPMLLSMKTDLWFVWQPILRIVPGCASMILV